MDKPSRTVGSVCVLMLCLALPFAVRPNTATEAIAEPALSQLNTDMVAQFQNFSYDSQRNLSRSGDEIKQRQGFQQKPTVSNTHPNCSNTVHKKAKRLVSKASQRKPQKPLHHVIGDFVLTAYTLDYHCTGKRPSEPGFGITYSGTHARVGRTIAVDPRVIPIGSRVFIEGIGSRIAEDTGGGVKGRHLDILFPSEHAAVTFGVKRHVRVYLEEIPR